MSKSAIKLVIAGLLTVVGFFGVGVLYTLFIKEYDAFGKVVATLGAFAVVALYYLRLKKKSPEVIQEMVIEQKDEREIMIREKAGHTTLLVLFACMFILSGLGYLTDNLILLLASGGSYLLGLIIYISTMTYYKRKL
jgi:hypothetical protein